MGRTSETTVEPTLDEKKEQPERQGDHVLLDAGVDIPADADAEFAIVLATERLDRRELLALPEELTRLERTAGAADWQREIAVQLMGRYEVRADEISYPADQHLRWSEDGGVWLFAVRGKNTAGGEPKVRDAWMSEVVADDIHKYSRERMSAADDPWCRPRH